MGTIESKDNETDNIGREEKIIENYYNEVFD